MFLFRLLQQNYIPYFLCPVTPPLGRIPTPPLPPPSPAPSDPTASEAPGHQQALIGKLPGRESEETKEGRRLEGAPVQRGRIRTTAGGGGVRSRRHGRGGQRTSGWDERSVRCVCRETKREGEEEG